MEITLDSFVKVYVDMFDVTARLEQLGLKIADLLDVVRAALQGRQACTELDPPMYTALSLWALGVRRLRQRVLPLGWSFSNEGGYCTVSSPDSSHAISVASGDEDTGKLQGAPQTLCPKGPRTFDAIYANQLVLDLRLPEMDDADYVIEQRKTWLLLIHIDYDAAQARAELSLPSGQDDQGRVTTWAERIILPSVDFQLDPSAMPVDDLPDIDIEIRRRA